MNKINNISFDEFKNRFINNKERFIFQLNNVTFTFFYQEPEYMLIVTDDFREKVYHSNSTKMIDLLAINGVKISSLWHYFKQAQ